MVNIMLIIYLPSQYNLFGWVSGCSGKDSVSLNPGSSREIEEACKTVRFGKVFEGEEISSSQ